MSSDQKHQRKWHHRSRRSGKHRSAGNRPSSVWVGYGFTSHNARNQRFKAPTSPLNTVMTSRYILLGNHGFVFLWVPLPPELQGVSWDGPRDMSSSVTETEQEPLYAVPRKDHHLKFSIDDFVLHKMLGKGSFGKVQQMVWFWEESRKDTNSKLLISEEKMTTAVSRCF